MKEHLRNWTPSTYLYVIYFYATLSDRYGRWWLPENSKYSKLLDGEEAGAQPGTSDNKWVGSVFDM